MVKIALVTSTWDYSYGAELLRGVFNRVKDDDVVVHVFNMYDEYQKSPAYFKQMELFSLPNVEQYDGMIMAIGTSDTIRQLDEFKAKMLKAGKPIVTTDQECAGAYFCGIDNYKSMYKMLEHIIEVHGARKINYVGGQEDHQENMLRLKAYEDCLTAHGIEIEPERIRFYSFLQSDGVKAFREFKEIGLECPDAVVCANDHMAVGYCTEAEANGYSIPEDMMITGFDNIDNGQTFIPSITSVNRNREQSGYDAIDYLLRIIRNEEVKIQPTTGYVKENESCGCLHGKRNLRKEYSDLIMKSKRVTDLQYGQKSARQRMCISTSFEQLQEAIAHNIRSLRISDMALCINQQFFEGDYSGEVIGFSDKINYYTKNSKGILDRAEEGIIPKEIEEENDYKVYVISPLSFRNRNHGYIVMGLSLRFFESGDHRTFTESVSLAVETLGQRMTLDGMNQQLQKLYVRDSLTGLYNRFGYAALSNGFFEKKLGKVYLVFVDLDNLKHINDCYGHAMGDIAIKSAAEAIKEAFDDTDILVRMGGDEYLVMGEFFSEDIIEEKERKAAEILKKLGEERNMPVSLEASMGHVVNSGFETNVSLETLVSRADQRMYEVKQARKVSRG